MDCLSDERIAEFVRGRLSSESRAGVEAHLAACPECCALVAAAARWWSAGAGDVGAGAGGSPDDDAGAEPAEPGPLAPGVELGRYRIVRPLGAGAAGAVYEAHDPQLDRRVAVKVLRRGVARGPGADTRQGWRRIQREGRALARLSHPNLLAVHDVGVQDGLFYLVLELCEGATLAEWLRGDQRTLSEILERFREAGAGLAAGHAAGVVHGDFKPANVLIDGAGRARVGDFGLARVGELRSPPGAPTGTPGFMAPEVEAGAPPEAASDQYSFCRALASALEGRTGVPRRIRRALVRGMAARPADRFASMEALLAAIEPRLAMRQVVILAAGAAVVLGLFAVALLRARGGDAGSGLAARPGPPGCGDGRVDPPEECDDGNQDDQDGCSNACLRCGGPGEFLWPGNGHCYVLVAEPRSWDGADARCGELGGGLAAFEHLTEVTAVRRALAEVLVEPTWIGLRVRPTGLRWQRGPVLDGSTNGILRRAEGVEQGCGLQRPRAAGDSALGLWELDDCQTRRPFLCERVPWWTRLQTGHAYRFMGSPHLTWRQAELACQRWGAHLVTVTDPGEQAFVARLVFDYSWLGASDVAEEGRFRWVTGERFEYQNFAPEQPNDHPDDSRGPQDCLVMGADGAWHDGWCDFAYGFVCERAP